MDYISKSHDLSRVQGGVILIAYISRSCDLPKKEIFDGLHKHLKNDFGRVFPKKEIPSQEIFDGLPKKEILMDYISNSEMVLEWVFPKRKFLFQERLSKKGNFDGLYKQLKNGFSKNFLSWKELPKKEIA